jgi:spore germination cell wall hydrolase CwlJ-like protein
MTPLLCLTAAIFFEAGVEDVTGKYLVGTVIMNRVEDKRYPNDVCSVVYQKKQFSFTHDGKSDTPPKTAKESLEVAKEVLQGNTLEIASTHYHGDYVAPRWRKVYTKDFKYGTHIFYTNDTPYR